MDLSELSAFAASLNHLEREEIQKAKVLFIKNKITTYAFSYSHYSNSANPISKNASVNQVYKLT